MKDRSASFWRLTLFGLIGPLVWAAHLGIIYGVQHVACSEPVSLAPAWIVAAIIAATFAAAAPLLFAVIAPRRFARLWSLNPGGDVMRFLFGTMRILSLLSLLGILWAGAAAGFIATCPPLR